MHNTPHTEESKKKMSLSKKGQSHPQNLETRKKIAFGKLGDKNPAKRLDVRKKISKANLGKHHSEETIRKFKGRIPWNKGLKGYKAGELNNNWKGGITAINRKSRTSTEYSLWRSAVVKRDNHSCIWCGSKKNLHADHVKPWVLFPELRFAIDNGRTLCAPCHRTTDTWGSRIKKYATS